MSDKYKLLLLTLYFSFMPLWIFSNNKTYNGIEIEEIIVFTDDPVKVIVIDPGHGGKDVGCLGNHLFEKEIALELALQVGEKINSRFPNIEVRYTRTTDIFVPLHERVAFANAPDVDLFLSIHCNALKEKSAHGIETYVMGLHTAEENLEIAKRENDVIALEDLSGFEVGFGPYSNEGHIMLSILQQNTLERSILWADLTQKAFEINTDFRNRGVKQAGFVVLRQIITPGILIEAGFISNPEDSKRLKSEEQKNNISLSIVQGIENYIEFYREQ